MFYSTFSFSIVSLSTSPPSSPNWDELLSVPIHKDFSGSPSHFEAVSHQHMIDESKSTSDISQPIPKKAIPIREKTINKVNNTKKRKDMLFSILTDEQREEKISAKRKKNAEYQKTRREKLKKPENAEKNAMIRKEHNKQNAAYRRRLRLEFHTGNASEKQKESYLKMT